MKALRSIMAALFTTAVAASDQPRSASKTNAEMMRELRLQWLTTTPTPAGGTGKVAAVLMDWPLDEQTATILASAAGDASVYTTGTFGIMGGIGDENARKAALSFIESANKHLGLATPTTDFSYPDRRHIRFFFVTDIDVRSVSFPTTEVEKRGTDAYDLYAHGQAVLTEMRLLTQRERGY